jgi:hypothetical protein
MFKDDIFQKRTLDDGKMHNLPIEFHLPLARRQTPRELQLVFRSPTLDTLASIHHNFLEGRKPKLPRYATLGTSHVPTLFGGRKIHLIWNVQMMHRR